MSSITDLPGDQLHAGLAQLVGPDASDAASAPSENAVETARDRAREAAMEAVLDEAGLDPADVRGELTLRDDLDMDGVSLYAVAVRVKHEVKMTLSDSQIGQRVIFAGLLDAASDAVSNHQRKTLPVELQRHSQYS